MGTITLSVPDELKSRMDATDWVNWSSVARRAFVDVLQDIKELELKRRIREISEISNDDKREVREVVVKEVIGSVDKTLKQGKKPMTSDKLDSLLGLK